MSLISDVATALGRVITQNRPSASGLTGFIGDEVLGTALGWTAGLISSALVKEYFVKKSLWNLGGLTAQRTALSGDEYGWTEWGISYGVGLLTVIVVRTLILGTLRELAALRRERR